MLTKDEIAEAARYADDEVEELGTLEAWAERHGIEIEGFVYVAGQRGLRAAYARDGKDPRKLSRTHFETIRLSVSSHHELPLLSATWMDGFAIGVLAGRREATA